MGNYTIFLVFENPRRGRQARNLRTKVSEFLDLNRLLNRYFPKLDLGCPWLLSRLSHKAFCRLLSSLFLLSKFTCCYYCSLVVAVVIINFNLYFAYLNLAMIFIGVYSISLSINFYKTKSVNANFLEE